MFIYDSKVLDMYFHELILLFNIVSVECAATILGLTYQIFRTPKFRISPPLQLLDEKYKFHIVLQFKITVFCIYFKMSFISVMAKLNFQQP